jgi:hypothetical protein
MAYIHQDFPARLEALAKGERRFDGPACELGHTERHTSSGRCVQCCADALRKHRVKVALKKPKSVPVQRTESSPFRFIGVQQASYLESMDGRERAAYLNRVTRERIGLGVVEVADEAPQESAKRKFSRAGWESAVREKTGRVQPERHHWRIPREKIN